MFQTPIPTFPQQSPSPPMDSMPALPENTMVAAGSTGEQKPRKMRASCDACSRAKVKCDKVRPTCHRCGNMGICCNYSPSMRLGKPRKNRNPDGTIMRDVSPTSSCGPLGHRAEMIPRTTASTSESSPEPTDPFFFGPGTPEYHYQDAFMANNFDGSQSPSYSEGANSLVNGWPSDEHLMFGHQAELLAPMPQYIPPLPFTGHVRSTSSQSQPDLFTSMDSLQNPQMHNPQYFGMPDPVFTQQEKMMASPPPMLSAPLPTPPATTTLPNHDCTQFAFQTLNSLYAPPETQPSAGDFNGTQDGLPTLDSVISINKAAVDKLYVLLSCPCSSNPHFSTTIAFTVVKILSWYQAVSGVGQQGEVSPIETKMEAFSYSPISRGGFRPEHEDSYRTNLVLSELRKLEKLVDKFSERYCKANPAETGIEGGVYSALEVLLRTRVRDTFQVTMRGAPENIKRQVASRTQSRARVHTM